VRPPRDDIATPPFPAGTEWIGEEPPNIERLAAGGPVLVHFFEVGEPSSVRTLPYLDAWSERYRGRGLRALGVHSPGFPFSAERPALVAALTRLGVRVPVANDRSHRIWREYGCTGWPSLFLWGRGGALRWYHFGEGEYQATEEAIRELLGDGEEPLPDPLPALRATDLPGARVMPPSRELFPGGSRERPWRPAAEGELIELDYAAGAAYATLDGEGELEVAIDGEPPRRVPAEAPGLHELAAHERHGSHHLALGVRGEVRIWSVSFAAGVP
jgi:thiol-disulfide isomerase/thioredoxin